MASPSPCNTNQSCANPLQYPGYRLASQAQWQQKCLGQASQKGNCAFQYYAAHPGGPPIPQGVSCGGETTGVHISATTAHNDDPVYKTVCFDNYLNPSDRLCIFQSFDVGNTNVEQMSASTRAEALAALIQGVGQEMPLDNKMFCLHHGDVASVGWTHLHTFTPPPPPGAWPDGLAPSNAYCSAWKGSALATAQALSAQVKP